MRITNNPDLLDRLAASYALGSLRGGARRRFETMARDDTSVRAAALLWQTRMASMTELQPPAEAPHPAVWNRIENLVLVDLEREAALKRRPTSLEIPSTLTGWWQNLALWRSASAAGALATVLAVVTVASLRDDLNGQINELQAQLQAAPVIEYVAVLNDDQARAAMLVTFDPKNSRLTLQRVSGFRETADKSLQLWALPQSGAPRSLGVLTQERLLQLTTDQRVVDETPALAISLEPRGGVPSETGPTGPVLFTGALIQKTL